MKIIVRLNQTFWLKGLTFFLAVSIVFRCSPELFYRSSFFEYAVILGLAVLSFHGLYRRFRLMFFEILMVLFPLFFLTAEGISKYMIFTAVGLYYYFRIQKNYSAFEVVRIPIAAFGVFTALVTWFSFFFPEAYIRHVLPLLPGSDALASAFRHRNMYMGFTTHYSRNAFYILIAVQILFAELFCGKREKRRLRTGVMLFLALTELLVAKRGPLLFLILSVMLTVILKEPELAVRIRKIGIYTAGLSAAGVLAILVVPGANNIVIRMAESMRTGDITTGRFELYRIGIGMFLEHPLLGCGWDSFRRLMSGTTDQGVHNDYIQLLGEVGIVGFLMMLTANFCVLTCTYRAYKTYRKDSYSGTSEQVFLSFSLAYQMFFLLDSLTGLPHFSYEINTLYLMAGGYGVGLYRRVKYRSGSSGSSMTKAAERSGS